MKRVKKERITTKMKSIVKAQVRENVISIVDESGVWGSSWDVADILKDLDWNNRKNAKARQKKWFTFQYIDGKYKYELVSVREYLKKMQSA